MLTFVLSYISFPWENHDFHEVGYHMFTPVFVSMVKSEQFPMFMWLPLTQFPDYNETVFSIDNHLVFSNKGILYTYNHT